MTRRIEALLLGQHQDDNVETVFHRLTNGSQLTGLRGMLGNTIIPECQGIYGASEGGSSIHLKRSAEAEAGTPRIQVDPGKRTIKAIQKQPVPQPYAASGGIVVCRPFLSCVKENLLATCRENGVAYATDSTNFDLSLTPRNAIRSLLASDDLPRALRPASILSVIEKSNAMVNDRHSVCNKLLQQCKILDFNARGGWMLVKFPAASEQPKFFQELVSTLGGAGKSTRSLANAAGNAEAMALCRISRLVSPFPTTKFPLTHFKPFTRRVFFPELGTEEDLQQRRKTFTVNGTMFQHYEWKARKSSKTRDHTNESMNPAAEGNNENGNIWLISRQPYMSNILPPARHFHAPASNTKRETYFTPWQLWDNRFWIRLAVIPAMKRYRPIFLPPEDSDPEQPPEAEIPESTSMPPPGTPTIPFVVRPLCANDITRACDTLDNPNGDGPSRYSISHESESPESESPESESPKSEVSPKPDPGPGPDSDYENPANQPSIDKYKLLYRLANNAPGQHRYTVPILMVMMPGKGGRPVEQPVGLPTMDVRLTPDWRHDFRYGKRWKVRWQWMYKSVDVECLQLMGWME